MGSEIEAKNISGLKRNLGMCQEKEGIERQSEKEGRQDFDQPRRKQVVRCYNSVRTFSV